MRRLVALAGTAALAAFFVLSAGAAAPTVTLISPSAGTIRGTVTLNATTSSGATEVRYYSDGVQVGIDSTCCSWNELWNTTTASEGPHTLTATARNAGGEVGTSAPVSVTIDNVPEPPPPPPVPPPPPPPPPTPPAPPPPPSGCAPGWFPVDGQSWWWQPSFGGDPEFNSRHTHVGGCIPRRESTLSGTVGFDIVVKMHNSPGRITYVAIVVKTDSLERAFSVNPGWTCPVADCTFTKHFDLAMSQFDKSGLEEIRFRATDRQPDGNELRASVNFQTHISNGKPHDDVGRFPFLRGKGWYSDLLYCEADYRDDLSPLPASFVSGLWTPQIRQVNHNAGDAPVTRHDARVDPNIHGGQRGAFLMDGPGQYQGPLAVDTAQLANGSHKLMLRSECETAEGRNSGVLVVPFEVVN